MPVTPDHESAVAEPTARELGSELIRLIKILTSMRQYVPTPDPALDIAHFPVLFRLAQRPRRVSDLAECVHADVSSVSRQVSHLVQHGFVRKAPDAQDGRAHLLDLTPAGHAAVESITARRGEWLRGVMHDWSQSDADALLTGVRRLGDDLEATKTRLTPGPGHSRGA